MSDQPRRSPKELFAASADGFEFATLQTKIEGANVCSEFYGELVAALGFFNERLFDKALSEPVVTFARRSKGTAYFRPERFERLDGERAHDYALTLRRVRPLGDAGVPALLARLQCEQWRFETAVAGCGRRPTIGYVDRRLAAKMVEIGLMPTDRSGGERCTGYGLSFRVADGGQLDLDCKEFLATGFRFSWQDRPDPPVVESEGEKDPQPKPTRAKFTCATCDLAAWAKPSAELACRRCPMHREDRDDPDHRFLTEEVGTQSREQVPCRSARTISRCRT